jgi:peptidoglycan/LPS O-acetylase OafA/YrhL
MDNVATSPHRPKPTIVGLDIIRFTAAAMVMLHHLGASTWAEQWSIPAKIIGGRAAYPELLFVTWFGWLGVEIFFVISGLVIVYSAEGATALKFLRSRALRLYPAAWICASITAITVLALGTDTMRNVLHQWLNSVILVPVPPYIDSVYWTLGVEMAFYGVIFLLLVGGRFHYLERLALVLGTLSSLYWILGNHFAPGFLHKHLWTRILELSLLPYGCFFSIGILTYVISRFGLTPGRALAISFFAVAGVIEVGYKTVHFDTALGIERSPVLPQILYVVALALIFASVRWKFDQANPVGRIIRTIGLATYPLYLIHQIVGAAIMGWILKQGGSKYLALGSAITICLAGSIFIVTVLEPPLRNFLRKAFDGSFGKWFTREMKSEMA